MRIPRLPFILLLTSLTTASLLAADAPNTLTDAEKAAGWVIEDGVLKRADKGGDIVTTEAYTDFELTWDWNVSKVGNSGLKYYLPDPKKDVGFEYQLIDDVNHPDGVKGGRLHQTGGLYDLLELPAGKMLQDHGDVISVRAIKLRTLGGR